MVKYKWNNIPSDLDTNILKRETVQIKGVECKHEYWTWDGVRGESLIFDINEILHLNENQMKNLCLDYRLKDSLEVTIKKTGPFVFVNFNFEIE